MIVNSVDEEKYIGDEAVDRKTEQGQVFNSESEAWRAVLKREERIVEIAAELPEKQPSLGVTAYVIAGDTVSAEIATRRVEIGVKPEHAIRYIGSYARFEWAMKHLPSASLMRMLPELWRGSDPDDTNPAFLKLWRSAWITNGRKTVYDIEPLRQTKERLIYRGQAADARVGIAWTTDPSIAHKFAMSGGLRGRIDNGVVLNSVIDTKFAYAYLTGRGEHEIIVDPKRLQYRIGKQHVCAA